MFSEISETILLIVSPACKVLYCGSAIVELLGWKEDQLVDADLGLFIEGGLFSSINQSRSHHRT